MADTANPLPTQRKPSFPINPGLRRYLTRYKRERQLPVTYERLRAFHEVIPLTDDNGKPTLWDTVIYETAEMSALNEALKEVYALLKVDGDLSVVRHLYVDRVDFCTFGNSTPFRIRIVNAYNDNQDYFYIKKADASRAERRILSPPNHAAARVSTRRSRPLSDARERLSACSRVSTTIDLRAPPARVTRIATSVPGSTAST